MNRNCPICGGWYDLVHKPGCPRSMEAVLNKVLRLPPSKQNVGTPMRDAARELLALLDGGGK
jgi:hypothetical protein